MAIMPPASRVMGLDPSKTATGVCVLGGTGVVLAEVLPKSPGYESGTQGALAEGIYQAQLISRLIAETVPEFVVIEGFAYGNQKTLAILVQIQTCIRVAIWRHNIPFMEVAPSSLQKFTIPGKQRKKEDMKLASFKRWKFEHESNDVVDAHALAQVGWALGRESSLKLTVPQTEVLAKVGLTYPPS